MATQNRRGDAAICDFSEAGRRTSSSSKLASKVAPGACLLRFLNIKPVASNAQFSGLVTHTDSPSALLRHIAQYKLSYYCAIWRNIG
jgi:hypothetical protein